MPKAPTTTDDIPEQFAELVERYQAFCDGHQKYLIAFLIDGMNQTEAYQASHPNASYDTARKAASKLMTNSDIKSFVDDYKKARFLERVMTKEEMLASLSDDARNTQHEIQHRLTARRDLAKLAGYNEAEKHEHNHKQSDPWTLLVGGFERAQRAEKEGKGDKGE